MVVSKFPKLGLLWLWGPITLCAELQLKWGLKQSWNSSSRTFQRYVARHLHTKKSGRFPTFSDRSQIVNLISGLSFGHNLCLKCSNGSCKSIFYTFTFQELSNYIRNSSIQWVLTPVSLFKNLEVHWDSNSQNGSSLGSVRVHSLTLSYIPGSMRCDSWASLLAYALASPCLGLEPKAKVETLYVEVANVLKR